MFGTIDQINETEERKPSRLRRAAQIMGIAFTTGILFGALYLGILLSE